VLPQCGPSTHDLAPDRVRATIAAAAVVLIALAGGAQAQVGAIVLLPLITRFGGPAAALFDAFCRAGALVFGGGHVVLPLLEAEVVGPGWVDPDAFLAG
jgi:chromate transporter